MKFEIDRQTLYAQALVGFYSAAAVKLSHTKFQSSDAEEVCTLVREAKKAFCQLENGFKLFQVSEDVSCWK